MYNYYCIVFGMCCVFGEGPWRYLYLFLNDFPPFCPIQMAEEIYWEIWKCILHTSIMRVVIPSIDCIIVTNSFPMWYVMAWVQSFSGIIGLWLEYQMFLFFYFTYLHAFYAFFIDSVVHFFQLRSSNWRLQFTYVCTSIYIFF